MNRSGRGDFPFRARDDQDQDEQLIERQALICGDYDDICDEEINSGQVAMRYRQQSDKDKPGAASNGYELKSVNGKPYRDNGETGAIKFTYYDIQPGDSLQSICLRYACPLNQVRRLNGLMTDQDFYGLRRLKLPLGKLGLLDDLLEQHRNGSQDLLMLDDTNVNRSRHRLVNSPGSALSVTKNADPRFRPLLSTGNSSDKINEVDKSLKDVNCDTYESISTTNGQAPLHHNSHSFSSLREFANDDTNIFINNSQNSFRPKTSNNVEWPQKSFIKSEIVPDSSQVTIDNMLTDEQPVVANVFEDLDYHVEKAKAAAETYEQRAADIVSGIESTSDGMGARSYVGSRPSIIPELFFSGENFGLNFKRLIMLIFFVCLVIPIVYMCRANVIKWN